jgi:plasmid maintenance system antidote protein VapI
MLNGHTGVSPNIAVRLEKPFGSNADAGLFMRMQYDLWEARWRAGSIDVKKRFAAAPPSWKRLLRLAKNSPLAQVPTIATVFGVRG